MTHAELSERLFDTISERDVAGVRAALSAGADPNAIDPDDDLMPAVVFAAYCLNVEIVKVLLDAGAAVESAGADGTTALVARSHNDDDLEMVRLLMARGADVNRANAEGDTPLTNAAIHGAKHLVEFLLAHGADPHKPDGVGCTARDLATQHRHEEIVAILLRAEGGTA